MTGAAVASAATGVVGMAKGDKAADAAEDSANQANAMAYQQQQQMNKLAEDGILQAQGMLDNWESTFGGLQDNLSDYYNNLDPDKFATQNKETFRQSMDKQMGQYNDAMAATGLQTAGMKDQAAKEAAFQTAQGNAAIDISAPEQVAQMQQGFLNFGEGQRNSADNAMQNALTRQGNYISGGNQGAMNAQNATTQQYSDSSAGYMGAGGNMMGSAIGLGIAGGGGTKPVQNQSVTGPVNGGTNVDSLNGLKVDW